MLKTAAQGHVSSFLGYGGRLLVRVGSCGQRQLVFAGVMQTLLGVLYAGMGAMWKAPVFRRGLMQTHAAILRCKPLLRTSLSYISEFFWLQPFFVTPEMLDAKWPTVAQSAAWFSPGVHHEKLTVRTDICLRNHGVQ